MAQMTTTPVQTQGFYLSGKWVEEGTPVEIRAPYDGTPIAQVFQATREHAEAAIRAAVRASGTTRKLHAFERQRVLRSIAQYITSRKEEFSRTLAQEAGKPLKAARTEVERSIFTFTVAAEESTRIPGEYLSLDWQQYTAGRWGIVRQIFSGNSGAFFSRHGKGENRTFHLSAGGFQRLACLLGQSARELLFSRSDVLCDRPQNTLTLERRKFAGGPECSDCSPDGGLSVLAGCLKHLGDRSAVVGGANLDWSSFFHPLAAEVKALSLDWSCCHLRHSGLPAN